MTQERRNNMNAPDKIYLPEEPDVFFQVEYDKDLYPVEYIRKDALLALLKTKLSHLQEDFDVYTGQRIILRELINEIESL